MQLAVYLWVALAQIVLEILCGKGLVFVATKERPTGATFVAYKNRLFVAKIGRDSWIGF